MPDYFSKKNDLRVYGLVDWGWVVTRGQCDGQNAFCSHFVFSIGPSISYLERTSDSVKYGKLSDNPFVEFTLPSILNPDFAPSGKHVLSATIQYAPYHLRSQTWSEELNVQLKDNVVKVLENYIPNISSMIESSYVLSPVNLESQFGLTEGNLNHGEI